MLAFILAAVLTVAAAVVYKNAVITLIAAVCVALCSLMVNYLFRPKPRNVQFNKKDYLLVNRFPLEVLTDDYGYPVYVSRELDEGWADFVSFKFVGKCKDSSNIKRVPRDKTLLIFDDIPFVKIYSANKKIKGNRIFSVFDSKAVDTIFELHTPDSFVAFLDDEMFLQK